MEATNNMVGGNSAEKRFSGFDSNMPETNYLATAEADSKEIKDVVFMTINAEQQELRTSKDHIMGSTREEMVYEYAISKGFGLDEGACVKQPHTALDGECVVKGHKNTNEPCGETSKMMIVNEDIGQVSNAYLTMSLGRYSLADTDLRNFTGLHSSASFVNSLSYNGAERDAKVPPASDLVHDRQKQLPPKQPQTHQLNRSSSVKETFSQAPLRVARPPAEGRGRNQLLPRYWPRITDQELQQITAGDSNCTITPLFEKMLSASDAGRIGRLVLPKACAEAYFPPISQPEGLPLKIQDVSGKDWVFQFRFWPNNNSRMYVLEGVTPCIQSMQLQAGDTVTFSRLDPGGKLVMGYRRAPSSLSAQENQVSALGATSTTTSTLHIDSRDNIPTFASLTGLFSQSMKNAAEVQVHGLQGQLDMSNTGYGWYKSEKGGVKSKESLCTPLTAGDKKRLKHINSKSKKPQIYPGEAAEFRITWEEAQDLLRSPPNVVPSIVTIDGYEFEEYEEPPVFGKRTIFTTRNFGPGEDQWAQCDKCGSWRKVPSNIFLPTKWSCADNVWDAERSSCNVPQELENAEFEHLLQHIKDDNKREAVDSIKATEPLSGLDALANAATGGENNMACSSSPAPTTKHPRHRPGCTCIVCIQPPSGKGPKHKPTCNCNVCMTVKRRFKTLMMRRKKRQSEREAENAARKKKPWIKDEVEMSNGGKWQDGAYSLSENVCRQGSLLLAFPGAVSRSNDISLNGNRLVSNLTFTGSYAATSRDSGVDEFFTSKTQIDLNSQPERDDEATRGPVKVSMMNLVQKASYPLDRYLKLQGLTSLFGPPQMYIPSASFSRNALDKRADNCNENPMSMLMTSDRLQDESCMGLGGANYDMETEI